MMNGTIVGVLVSLCVMTSSGEVLACLSDMPNSPKAESFQDPTELSLIRISMRVELVGGGHTSEFQKITNAFLSSCWNYGGRILWRTSINEHVGWLLIRPNRSYFFSIPTQDVEAVFADLDQRIPKSLRTTYQFERVRIEDLEVVITQLDGRVRRDEIKPWELVDPVKAAIRMPYWRQNVCVVIARPHNQEWLLPVPHASQDPNQPGQSKPKWWEILGRWFF